MLRTVSRKVAKRQAVKLRNFDPGLACNDDPWLNKDLRTNAVESTASIGGHPIQAILIPSPIAFFGGGSSPGGSAESSRTVIPLASPAKPAKLAQRSNGNTDARGGSRHPERKAA
jgi:hypothetical protein